MNTLPVRPYKMFSVNNRELTERIASHHNAIVAKHDKIPLEFPMGNLQIETFSDGEMSPQFQESIREKRVFLIGSTNTPDRDSKNDSLYRCCKKSICP
jgi:ribose-phosphate pyrophosphokinase